MRQECGKHTTVLTSGFLPDHLPLAHPLASGTAGIATLAPSVAGFLSRGD